MSQLSLRNNRFEFKTSGCLPIILEEFRGIYLKLMKKNQKMSTCNQLDLATLGSQPVNAQKPPQTDIGCTLGNSGDGMSGPLLVFFFFQLIPCIDLPYILYEHGWGFVALK